MSNPQETKIARNIRPLESALDVLNTQMKIWGIQTPPLPEKLGKAFEQSLLFGEHTWGMNAEYGPRYSFGDEWKQWLADANTEPVPVDGDYTKLSNSNSRDTKKGRKTKWLKSYDAHRQYILNTRDIITSELDTRLSLLARSANVPGKRFVIYNPLPWMRSGMVKIPGSEGRSLFVKDVPANGFVTISEKNIKYETVTTDQKTVLITPNFTAVFDLKKGGVTSLIEKNTNRELVDQSSVYVMGQFLHECFSSIEVDKWFKTYCRIKDPWALDDLGKPGMPAADKVPYQAYTPDNWKISTSHTEYSDIATLTTSETQGLAKNYTMVFAFPRNEAYMDVEWKADSKTPEKLPEGGWLCFPFAIEKPIFTIGRLGGPVNPATEIISGTERKLMAVNTGVAITGADNKVAALCPIDSPLLSFGEPGLWKFSMDYIPTVPAVFVNLYNNMYNTNFPLWQQGSWTERVRIWLKPKSEQTVDNLILKSWEARQPLLIGSSEVEGGKLKPNQQGLNLSRSGVLVTAFGENPDGYGTILRLWEQSGIADELTVKFPSGAKFTTATPVNLRGEKLGQSVKIKNGKFSFNLKKYAPVSFVLES